CAGHRPRVGRSPAAAVCGLHGRCRRSHVGDGVSPAATLRVWSTAFDDGGTIPDIHTCQGDDRAPPLLWSTVPSDTRSLAVLCEDPDAPGGRFVHWVLYNLPVDATELAEGVPPMPELPSGARQGMNDSGGVGWTGPCPPPGKPHRYVFTCMALATMLQLDAGVTIDEFRTAAGDQVLAEGTLTGMFGR